MSWSERLLVASFQVRQGILVTHLSGTLATGTYADAFKRLREQVLPGLRGVVLDLSGVDYMSSGGLAALIRLRTDLELKTVPLALASVPPFVQKLLDGIGIALNRHADPEQAVAALSASARTPAGP